MTERNSSEQRNRVVAGALAMMLTFGVGSAAMADDPEDKKKRVDKELALSKKNLDGISKDLTTAVGKVNATSKAVTIARKKLGKAERELSSANKYNRDIGARLKIAKANESKSLKALSQNKAAQKRTKVLVGGIARRSYMKGGLGDLERTLDVLTAKDGSGTNSLTLAGVLARQQGNVMNTLAGQRSSGKSESARLSGVRRQISSLKIKAEGGVTRAKKAKSAAQRAKSSLDGLLKKQKKAVGGLEAKKKKEKGDISRLQKESKKLGDLLRKRAKKRAQARAAAAARNKAPAAVDQVKKSPSDGHFLTGPAPKSQISSPFGYRMHPILRVTRLHGGADFSFGCGTPVYAAAAGEVITSGYNDVSGNHVIIDHGDVGGTSLATQYDHLSATAVKGGSVKKGQLIGRVGTTGRSTGCHLHFVVLANGNYVNPADWIG